MSSPNRVYSLYIQPSSIFIEEMSFKLARFKFNATHAMSSPNRVYSL